MAKSATAAPSYDANQPDAETNVEWREAKLIEQAAAPAKRKRGPGRPKGSKNKTRVASYDGNAAPSPEPEFEPDRPKQSTTVKAIADQMVRKPKRRGRPPGSKNKTKSQVAA